MENDRLIDNLKPCPFCGGEVEMLRPFNVYGVQCKQCNAGIAWGSKLSREEVITAWNTREPMDGIVEQLEEAAFQVYTHEYDFDLYLLLSKATEIVKGGGGND